MFAVGQILNDRPLGLLRVRRWVSKTVFEWDPSFKKPVREALLIPGIGVTKVCVVTVNSVGPRELSHLQKPCPKKDPNSCCHTNSKIKRYVP